MPTFRAMFEGGVADVRNHYDEFLTGQNAPMIAPENSPPSEAPYRGLSHSERDAMVSAPTGEAAPDARAAPTGLNGETLAPEAPAGRASAFDRLTSHAATDADYSDITGQQSLPAPSADPAQEDSNYAPEL